MSVWRETDEYVVVATRYEMRDSYFFGEHDCRQSKTVMSRQATEARTSVSYAVSAPMRSSCRLRESARKAQSGGRAVYDSRDQVENYLCAFAG